jgi:hypothetical protein
MAIILPWWGWALCAVALLVSWLFSYACGEANGNRDGVDWMKRQAIGAGVAKACDFDGGWRWWTPQEIIDKYHWLRPTPTQGGEE